MGVAGAGDAGAGVRRDEGEEEGGGCVCERREGVGGGGCACSSSPLAWAGGTCSKNKGRQRLRSLRNTAHNSMQPVSYLTKQFLGELIPVKSYFLYNFQTTHRVSEQKKRKGLISDWPLVHLNVLLDILVGHLREMHGKWPVHGHLLFLALLPTELAEPHITSL